jgi:type VI secretion system secreted protein Hcp
VSTGGSGSEDRLTEHVTLNFSKYTYTYTIQNAQGNPTTSPTHGWDIKKNTKL